MPGSASRKTAVPATSPAQNGRLSPSWCDIADARFENSNVWKRE